MSHFQESVQCNSYISSSLSKLSCCLKLVSGIRPLHIFPIKIFLKYYSNTWPSFNIRTSFLHKISNNLHFKVKVQTHYEVINLRIYLQSASSKFSNGSLRKKEGNREVQKLNISRIRAFSVK